MSIDFTLIVFFFSTIYDQDHFCFLIRENRTGLSCQNFVTFTASPARSSKLLGASWPSHLQIINHNPFSGMENTTSLFETALHSRGSVIEAFIPPPWRFTHWGLDMSHTRAYSRGNSQITSLNNWKSLNASLIQFHHTTSARIYRVSLPNLRSSILHPQWTYCHKTPAGTQTGYFHYQ